MTIPSRSYGVKISISSATYNAEIIEGEMVPTGVKGGRGEVSLLQRHITNLEGKFVVI